MKEKVSMVVFVLILGIVLTGALVAVENYTKDRIAANKAYKIKTRVLSALSISHTPDSVEQKFSENITEKEINRKKIYLQNGNVAFQIEGSGLWGHITGILALQPDLETIKGMTIINQAETPGLGGRIAEKDFLDMFKGKKLSPQLVITRPGKAKAENEVDGITGATLTGKAFENIINSQAKEHLSLLEKGN